MSARPRAPRESGRDLPRSFYDRSVHDLAPDLLHKVLIGPNGSGRIVEVESYAGRDDPGSHAFRGPTPRTAVMHGPPGHLYVYFTYGMHWCANLVAEPDGTPGAVLIRALAPLTGLPAMFAARTRARRTTDLCNGPAKLCQALGIDGAHKGVDVAGGRAAVRVVDDGVPPPPHPDVSTRIGLTRGADLPWRFFVAGDPHVSRRSTGSGDPTGSRA